jgi:transcriptional regulator GlxA family with amidase domain
MNINCLLYDEFESLDLFGPVEVFGGIEEYDIKYFSLEGGPITSSQHTRILTDRASTMDGGILLIPGGQGTWKLVEDDDFIAALKSIVEKSTWCLTVCTGSGLLAKTGLLDNRRATSNKMAFEWAKSTGARVHWVYRARWVVDEKYYTASGVSAGIDMSLGFVADRFGKDAALLRAEHIEYEWQEDKDTDPFAV